MRSVSSSSTEREREPAFHSWGEFKTRPLECQRSSGPAAGRGDAALRHGARVLCAVDGALARLAEEARAATVRVGWASEGGGASADACFNSSWKAFRFRTTFGARRGGPERGRALGRALARPSASPSVGPPRRARKCENEKRKVHFTGRVPFAVHLNPFNFIPFLLFSFRYSGMKTLKFSRAFPSSSTRLGSGGSSTSMAGSSLQCAPGHAWCARW